MDNIQTYIFKENGKAIIQATDYLEMIKCQEDVFLRATAM